MSLDLETIFTTAADKSGVERTAFLDEACGDDAELRRRLEALLKAHADAGSFLDKPPAELEATLAFDENVSTDAVDHATRTVIELDPPKDDSLDCLEPCQTPGRLGQLGQYEIMEIIGRGGMGVVLKAHDTKLIRTVAIKVLSPELASNKMASRRFLREAQAAAAVSHDHVVRIYAVHDDARIPYLVMECIDGLSVEQKIDRQAALELKEILRIGRQIAAGLAEAHRQGLVHRDVKPSNILLENGIERVKITDFGLARAVDDVGITQTGQITGTPQYMAPEQAQGEPVDHRADLFSLGSVLYAMCTGRPAFRAESTMAVLRRVCDDAPRPIREVNPEIPEFLARIVDRLLEKKPGDRIQTADELAEILGRHLAHLQHPTHTPPPELDRASGGRKPPVASIPVKTSVRAGTHPEADASGLPAKGRAVKWLTAGGLLLAVCLSLGLTEATGVTNLAGTIIRLATGEGTLIIETNDPGITLAIDGEEVTIRGAGVEKLTLKPGKYRIAAFKHGKPVQRELVTITRGGKQVVRISLEGTSTSPAGDPTAFHPAADFPTLAPFDAARWEGTTPTVRVNGTWYKLLGIDGLPVRQIVTFCRQIDEERWQKRFEEDLVQVMSLLGHRPGKTVELIVKTSDRPAATVLKNVPMSHENRQALWQAREKREGLSSGVDGNEDKLTEIRRFEGHDQRIAGLAWMPDGRRMVSASGTELRMWDTQTGEQLLHLADTLPPGIGRVDDQGRVISPSSAYSLAVSPDGRLAATGHHHGVVCLWDLQAGRQIHRILDHCTADGNKGGSYIYEVAFTPDGKQLMSASVDTTIRFWDVASGKAVGKIDFGERVRAAAISPDGKYVLAGGFSSDSLTLIERESGRPARQFSHRGSAMCIRFSPDGRLAITGEGGNLDERPRQWLVRVWDVETGELLHELKGHTLPVEAVDISADGRLIASGGRDRTICIWDAESGRRIAGATTETDVTNQVAFSPDGRHVLSGGGQFWNFEKNHVDEDGDYLLRLWRLPQSVWPERNKPSKP